MNRILHVLILLAALHVPAAANELDPAPAAAGKFDPAGEVVLYFDTRPLDLNPSYIPYCFAKACGLQGNKAPVTQVPRALKGADLAGRRYGWQNQKFKREVATAISEFQQLRKEMKDFDDTPFALDTSELNRRMSDFFARPNLLQSLSDVYPAPSPMPSTLPHSAAMRLDQIWSSMQQGDASGFAEAANRVYRLQRYVRNLSRVGGQPNNTTMYLKAELRRNFVDEHGIIRFLGNHDVFAGLVVGPSPDPVLNGEIVDGINSLVIADYVLREKASMATLTDAQAAIGAIASAYGTASALAATDKDAAIEIVRSLDFAARMTRAFIDGFLGQGAAAIDGFVTMISNPLTTAEAVYLSIRHIDRTAKLIASAVEAKYDLFITGTGTDRAVIVGEISFEAAALFLTGGATNAVKYGSKAVDFINGGAAKMAVKRQFAKVARIKKVNNLDPATRKALGFIEKFDPDTALRLYRAPPARIKEIGRQLELFLDSKSSKGPLGRDFLRSERGAFQFYSDQLPQILDMLESGNSIKVYAKLPWIKSEARRMEYIRQWTTRGLKGPLQKKFWEAQMKTNGSRVGPGRYVTLDPKTSHFEVPGSKDSGWLMFEAEFRNVPNAAGGYVFFPSTRHRGGIVIFDRALDDHGAFGSVKLIDQKKPR